MRKTLDYFKQIQKETRAELTKFDKETKWMPIPCDDENRKRVKLYEATGEKGEYLLKAQVHFADCDQRKLLELNIDNFFETRDQWETGELMGIEQVQQFVVERINVVRYWIEIPVITNREFLGIQWWFKTKKHKSIILFFKSIEYDEFFPCDTSKYVRGTCMSTMRISKKGLVTVYTHVHPNGAVPSMILPLWKEKLRDRMLLYEKVIQTNYDEIYKEWECKKCGVTWTVNTEKCRRCVLNKALAAVDQ